MNAIRIGNQSAASAYNQWAPFEFALQKGFDAFEWFSDKKFHPDGSSNGWDENDMDGGARESIKNRARQANMRLSVHAPWQANPLLPEGGALLMRSVDFARDIGAVLVNLHLYMNNGAGGYVSSLRPLMRYARRCNIAITIENTVHTTPGDFNEVFELLRMQQEFEHGLVGMCLDIGHANLCSVTHNDYVRYMDELAPHVPIQHVHAHENFGDADSHLALFTGPAAKNDAGVRLFVERLMARKYSGAIILEQWPQPAQLLVDARARLRAMISLGLSKKSEKAPPAINEEIIAAAAAISIPASKSGGSIPAVSAATPARLKAIEPPPTSSPSMSAPKEGRSADAKKGGATPSSFDAVKAAFDDLPVLPKRPPTSVKPSAPSAQAAPAKAVTPATPPTAATVAAGPKPPKKSPPVDLAPVRDTFVRALVENHGAQKSWRGRLQWIRDRFADESFSPTRGDLASVAVYLRFLATGEAPCEEDGGHFRPNHHAQAAEQIEAALQRVAKGENAWIARRIRPYLPSFAEDFRRAEPLTRIRDIAHRNDIPRELKEEIKHTLQNKLHRCAGPEDLRTSADILARITTPGAKYPAEFVAEFQLFHHELSAFFNATSLEERLDALRQSQTPQGITEIDLFLKRNTRAPNSIADRLLALTQALCVRELCAKEGGDALARARAALADAALEEYAFTRLSDVYNQMPGARAGEEQGWLVLMNAVILALENTRLSLVQSDECTAVVGELRAWMSGFDPGERLHLLRLKASFERAQRIAGEFANEVIELFQARAVEIGRAIGVSGEAIHVFTEGDLRGSVIFQLSKIAERGVQDLRHALDLPAWEPVVPGEATGRVLICKSLRDVPPGNDALIVVLEGADGDEEIPTPVSGVVLSHALPHLSHLCVRARQAHVPFALTDDLGQFEAVKRFNGRSVLLRVLPDSVRIREADSESGVRAAAVVTPVVPEPDVQSAGRIVPVEDAAALAVGGKAAAAGRLRQLARESNGLFLAPRGVALPFGSLEVALARDPELTGRYGELSRTAAGKSGPEQQEAIDALSALIADVALPDEWIAQIGGAFDDDVRLAVRSSANGEDLEQFAGAGLYESLLNVRRENIPEAIRYVWSSLWTPRAVRTRAQLGIGHDRIRMSVLIQELIDADYSFIMHTTDTVAKSQNWATVELCAGLGETLASASQSGAPYRLRCGRRNGEVRIEACASFSYALRAQAGAGTFHERLDYSKVGLSADAAAVRHIGLRLARLAEFLETQMGGAQDVEGVVRSGMLCVVQARPQQGL
jgi:phosphoglucan, water dikinase